MDICQLLKFLDNATVAGLVTVFAGFWIGSKVYINQKKIDRKYAAIDKLAETLLLLAEH